MPRDVCSGFHRTDGHSKHALPFPVLPSLGAHCFDIILKVKWADSMIPSDGRYSAAGAYRLESGLALAGAAAP